MTPNCSDPCFPAPAPDAAQPIACAEDARHSLERLLNLGVRVVDGDVKSLLDIPVTLAIAIQALDNVHAVLAALPTGSGPRPSRALAGYAEHRRQLDSREFDKLSAVVRSTDQPQLVGRSVVITALVLLSNLASDERRWALLNSLHRAA